MGKLITLIAATIVAVSLVGTGAAVGAAYMYNASPDNPVSISGCVIRFDGKTASGNTLPRIHANSTHYCVGVRRVYAEYPSGALVIEQQASGPGDAVVAISVSPDELLVSRGIDCGASGGRDVTRIFCYDRNGRVKAYSSRMYARTSNLWVGWTSWAQ